MGVNSLHAAMLGWRAATVPSHQQLPYQPHLLLDAILASAYTPAHPCTPWNKPRLHHNSAHHTRLQLFQCSPHGFPRHAAAGGAAVQAQAAGRRELGRRCACGPAGCRGGLANNTCGRRTHCRSLLLIHHASSQSPAHICKHPPQWLPLALT